MKSLARGGVANFVGSIPQKNTLMAMKRQTTTPSTVNRPAFS